MYLNSINDGSNSANFGSSVFDGYGHVVVLVSLIVTSNVRSSLTSQHFIGLLEPLVVVCGAVVCRFGLWLGIAEVAAHFARFGAVYRPFPGLIIARFGCCGWVAPLLLLLFVWAFLWGARQAVFGWVIIFKSGSPGRPKLLGSDSRLNLAHPFAASCWCGLSCVLGLWLWWSCLLVYRYSIECVFRILFFLFCFLLSMYFCHKLKTW